MDRRQLITLIREITRTPNAFDTLENALVNFSKEQVSEHLLECGIIPEEFKHDSSEEKLWAKLCDIFFAKSLSFLGIQAEVLRTRGDSADVFGNTDEYTIVGDAKAFRLSRTAKNQKDFKVSALDAWRRSNTFACLVAPLYQFPSRNSQIYEQAKSRNVTLLSYIHLKYLLDYPPTVSLNSLWQAAGSLPHTHEAQIYWQTLDHVLVGLTNTSAEEWDRYKQTESDHTRQIGTQEIIYWETVKASYFMLSQPEVVQRLIKAEKIDEKIRTIQSAISRNHIL